jgi:hypothetical protein
MRTDSSHQLTLSKLATQATKTYSTTEKAFINFYETSSGGNTRILDIAPVGTQSGASGGSEIRFLTNPANSDTASARMVITKGGDVGIGTSSPSVRLHNTGTSIFSGNITCATSTDNIFTFTKQAQQAVKTYSNTENCNIAFYEDVNTPFRRILDIAPIGTQAGSNGGSQIRLITNVTGTDTGAVRFSIDRAVISFPSIDTTASAANAFLDASTGQLLRSTSSLRYKTDIEHIETNRSNAILDFRPVWYRSIAEADKKDWSWYGLIAEEVAEIEPRLVHWTYLPDAYEEVTKNATDEDGNLILDDSGKPIPYTEKVLKADAEMVPDGVQYDRLTVLLLDVVKRQNERIETLEAKVAALEANRP